MKKQGDSLFESTKDDDEGSPCCLSQNRKREGKLDTPSRAIDLELQVREAMYEQYSSAQWQALLTGVPDSSDALFQVAWEVVPKIWPVRAPEAVTYLTDLAIDVPELLMREPEDVQGMCFNYDLLPLTPLRLLHANAVDLAMCYGRDELARFPQLGTLSAAARRLYGAMQKGYVVSGYSDQGQFWIREVLRTLGLAPEWHQEDWARTILGELIQIGLVERRSCQAEAYELTVTERHRLIERYRLATKWPEPRYPNNEIAQIEQEMAE